MYLKRLDLSHNNLDCDTIFKFLNNNKRSFSLKYLNLSYNLLDDTFFEQYMQFKLYNIFDNLKSINLEANQFGTYLKDEKKDDNEDDNGIKFFEKLYEFISTNSSLNEIILTKNPIKDYYMLNKKELDKKEDIEAESIIKDENDNVKILSFYSFLYKIKYEILDRKKNQNSEHRVKFNFKFDCINLFNINTEKFDFTQYIIQLNRNN